MIPTKYFIVFIHVGNLRCFAEFYTYESFSMFNTVGICKKKEFVLNKKKMEEIHPEMIFVKNRQKRRNVFDKFVNPWYLRKRNHLLL